VTSVDVALLLLRVVLGCLMVAHGTQKAFGWFSGPGFTATSGAFHAWGFRPGPRMVVVASVCEVTGGLLLVLGLATPLACAILIGTLAAATSPNFAKGFWAAAGGIELPVIYAVIAAALALSGGGAFSIDALIRFPGAFWIGPAAIVVGVVGATVALLARRRELAREGAPGVATTN